MTAKAIIFIAVSSKKQAEDDKASLEEQEKAARHWATENGFEIVRLLAVRGYPRSDSDLMQFFEEMESIEEYAYRDLMHLWRENLRNRKAHKPLAFDVLIAWREGRLGRSQSLITLIIENILKSGAKIYFLNGGWYEPGSEARYKTAFSAVSAANEIDQLVQGGRIGRTRRMQRGLTGNNHPIMYKLLRDERGKAIKLVINDDLRPMLRIVTDLFLKGMSWARMARSLDKDYGYANPKTQRRYSSTTLYDIFHSPYSWGHAARNFKTDGNWMWDDAAPLPEGTEIIRDAVPPLWEGQEAEAIRAELKRRTRISGKASPENTKRYTALLVCEECGCNLGNMKHTLASGKTYEYYTCHTRYRADRLITCSQTQLLKRSYIDAWVHERLTHIIETGDTDTFFMIEDAPDPGVALIAALESQSTKLNERLRGLILDNATEANAIEKETRRDLIAQVSEQLGEVRKRLESARRAAPVHRVMPDQKRAAEQLRDLTLDNLWKLTDREINQWLHRFFGDYRMMVSGGFIVGIGVRDE